MAAPVWTLSVDLQTKTATFTTGLADAARSARSSFTDIKNSSKEMGEGVAQSSLNIRSAIGLVDNTIRGAHTMAIADMVREFQNTRVVMAALPFAVTAAGFATVLGIVVEVAQKVKEYREESEKLKQAQTQFGTTVQESFNTLDERMLQAEKRSDELRNDHIGALNAELRLIGKQSFDELIKEFGIISKAADDVFSKIENHWYTLGSGSAGASRSLAEFKTQYEALLASGDGKSASDLLAAKLERERTILAAQQQANDNVGHRTAGGTTGDYSKVLQAEAELRRLGGAGHSQDEVAAQRELVTALERQVQAHQKIADLSGKEGGNARQATANESSARASEAAKQAASSQLAIAEQVVAADRATANARLEIAHASANERLESDLAFTQRELEVKLAGNAAEQAALNKAGPDFNNQLANLRNKALEIEQQHATEVAELTARAAVEQAKRDVEALQDGERQKIQATQEGSQARLDAIDAAIAEEQGKNLTMTEFYRTLGTQRVDVIRQMGDAEKKARADAGKEEAEHQLRLGQLKLAALQESQTFLNSARRLSDAETLAQELAFADMEYDVKKRSLQQQMEALNESGPEYQVKLKALQNREIELLREHEDHKTALIDKSEVERNNRLKMGLAEMEQDFARSFMQVLGGHTSFVSMMSRASDQLTGNLITAGINAANGLKSDKLEQAKDAARWGFHWGAQYGGPLAPVLAPAMAATFFTGVMAFNKGGMVPGVGNGDVVPAMLTPGEVVLPKNMVERLNASTGDGGGSGPTYHLHVRPTYNVQTIDGDGMQDALDKHNDVLIKHVENTLRKMNR